MQKITEEFRQNIFSNTLQTRAYLQFEEQMIKDDGSLVSIILHDECYDDETDTILGTFIGRYGEAVILNQNHQDYENQIFTPYFGVVCDDGETQYISYSRMHIYETKQEENDLKLTVKFIDDRILFNQLFDDTQLHYPLTWRELLTAACNQVNVPCSNAFFLNDEELIEEPLFFGLEATCADVVKAIAQASGTFAKITRDNQLKLCWFEKTPNTVLPENYFDLSTQTKYGPINSLVLGRDPQNDNVYLKDEEAIEKDGLHELRIVNNPLLDTRREALIIPLFNLLKGFHYTSFTCHMQGFPAFDCGDTISLKLLNNTAVDSLILNHTISFQGSLLTQIDSPALTSSEISYEGASSIEKKVLETELKVDKAKGEITARIDQTIEKFEMIDGEIKSEVQEISNTMTQTMDALDITIKKVDQNENEVNSAIENVNITIDGIRNQITSTGGNNLFDDSMGIFGNRFGTDKTAWEGIYAIDHSQDVKNRNIYGYAIMLMNGELKQQKTVPNGTYTVSFEYCKHIVLSNAKAIVNGYELDLISDEYAKLEFTVEVTTNVLDISFISDTDQACTICNLMGNQGPAPAVYSLAQGESWNDYVKIGRGIEIGSDASEVTFNANADVIGFKNKSGQYITVYTDTGADMKEMTVKDKAIVVGLLFQKINGQTVLNQIGVD